jgi:hypothetical protein
MRQRVADRRCRALAQQRAQLAPCGDSVHVEAIDLTQIEGLAQVAYYAAFGWRVASRRDVPAATAAGTIASGQLAGLPVPAKTAVSSAAPTASGQTFAQQRPDVYRRVVNDRFRHRHDRCDLFASSCRPAHAASVVCLRPVSPFTKYAIGSALSTGIFLSFEDIGTVRQSVKAALCSMARRTTSAATSSSMKTSASAREMMRLHAELPGAGVRRPQHEADHAELPDDHGGAPVAPGRVRRAACGHAHRRS